MDINQQIVLKAQEFLERQTEYQEALALLEMYQKEAAHPEKKEIDASGQTFEEGLKNARTDLNSAETMRNIVFEQLTALMQA